MSIYSTIVLGGVESPALVSRGLGIPASVEEDSDYQFSDHKVYLEVPEYNLTINIRAA